jgi:hypothetical protein
MTLEFTVDLWEGNTTDANPGQRVLALPGSRYSAQLPGLAWPMRALALKGWQVWCAAWDLSRAQGRDDSRAIVEAAIARFTDQAGTVPELIVAKSIGTLAAGWVADHSVPTVWTTPLLSDAECVEHITRASSPALLVAGSHDQAWDDDAAKRTGKQVVVIPGADHGWVADDWRIELDVLAKLTAAVEGFAAQLTGDAARA